MDENDQNSDTLFPHETGHGHHRSARQRQRQGPMWGCLKALIFVGGGAVLLLFLIVGGGWWYIGSENFTDLIETRIAGNAESASGTRRHDRRASSSTAYICVRSC